MTQASERFTQAKEDLQNVRYYREPSTGSWYCLWRNWPAGNPKASWWEGVFVNQAWKFFDRCGGGQSDRLPRDVVPADYVSMSAREVPEGVRDAIFQALLEGL